MKAFMPAVLIAVVLGATRVASAAGSLPLPAAARPLTPPVPRSAPVWYRGARHPYDVRGYGRAHAGAFRQLHQPAPPAAPVPNAPVVAPAFPGPLYFVIPDELPATPANAQRYVALAHRAMVSCVAEKTAATEYRGALSALDAKRYRVAMAASRNVVDDCAVR